MKTFRSEFSKNLISDSLKRENMIPCILHAMMRAPEYFFLKFLGLLKDKYSIPEKILETVFNETMKQVFPNYNMEVLSISSKYY